jgi:MFS family permease
MSVVAVSRSVGYLLGSAAGPLFDYIPVHTLFFGAICMTAVAVFLIPWATSVWLLVPIGVAQGLTMGFLDTGANIAIIWLHGDEVGPYMQTMHLFWGIGSFVSPLIVRQVLALMHDDPSWTFWILAGE